VFGLKKRESAIICNIYGDNGEIITIITMYLAVLNYKELELGWFCSCVTELDEFRRHDHKRKNEFKKKKKKKYSGDRHGFGVGRHEIDTF
jgi:hypothetical protein